MYTCASSSVSRSSRREIFCFLSPPRRMRKIKKSIIIKAHHTSTYSHTYMPCVNPAHSMVSAIQRYVAGVSFSSRGIVGEPCHNNRLLRDLFADGWTHLIHPLVERGTCTIFFRGSSLFPKQQRNIPQAMLNRSPNLSSTKSPGFETSFRPYLFPELLLL